MNILNILNKRSRFFYVFLAFFGIINSTMASSILYFINTKLVGNPLPFLDQYDLEIFAGILLFSLLVSYRFEMYMIGLTERIGVDMQKYIFEYLRYSDYERYLKLSEEKVRTAFMDVSKLQSIPHTYVAVLNNLILVVTGITYLFITNWVAASMLLSIIGITTAYFLYEFKSIQADKNKVRDLVDVFIRILNDFLRGFRELKMSVKRSDNIFAKFVIVQLTDIMLLKLKYLSKYILNRILGRYSIYLIIGVILFVLPGVANLDVKSMMVFITTALFIAGPISDLITQSDALSNIAISVNRLDEFEKVLKANMPPKEGLEKLPVFSEPFKNIRLENIEFEYLNRDKASNFKLAQLNLKIEKGDVIFITGGNGSGKSTFINLLTGLYRPTKGHIYYNDHLIETDHYPNYRNLLSCVFADNYLFTENYDDFDIGEENEYFFELLEQMQLRNVIHIDKENNRVGTSLSKGQQKRLALIFALMEGNEFFVFDEWAAEQDPSFRKYFYRTIIPQLKAMGKTVIAITHDDAYFDCADRIIKFEFGVIVKNEMLPEKLHALDVEVES
ncbi:MAG: ATP-binding protein [Saprospiraceae bacterium]|nr:MAG: ATP-binding protein [Saprospiraceae bacterium]